MPRRTKQRQAITRVFERTNRPLSPEEIRVEASRWVPGIGVATVYRAIRALVASGHLRAVALPGAADRYERSAPGHHHHFHCQDCDRVFDVDACPGTLSDIAPKGFAVEAHDIILYGSCRECREPARR